MKNKFLVGKGLSVNLSLDKINNLYKPTSDYRIESLDYVYVKNSLSKKFAPILFKEWFFLVKPGGFVVIEYEPSNEINFDYLESILFWIFKGKYIISEHKASKYLSRLVFQKKNTIMAAGDSMDKWTFGIVTNGERDDWLEEIIQSIRAQKIPHYEIIVCGKYKDRKEKDFVYIDFNERSNRGWITKKKNLICEQAKYENLCIIHDRLVLDKDWYKGMRRYGNAFELLGCVQLDRKTGIQAGDWLTWGGPVHLRYRISRLHYIDWDYYAYLSGQLVIIKKSIWKQVLWNESHYWNVGEDADFNFRARDLGFLTRFNAYAKCIAITWRHGALPLKYNPSEGLIPKDMLLRRVMRVLARTFYAVPIFKNIRPKHYSWFFKSRLYTYFTRH